MRGNIKVAQILAIGLALTLVMPMVAAQIPLPVTVQGIVTYENGTLVPDGWTVSLENLDEEYADEPWTTETEVSGIWNYFIVGTAAATSTFEIMVSDPTGTYTGNKTFTAGPFDAKILNITVREAGDIFPPIVTNPTATPPSIPADGITTSQLNVTVTDDSGVDSVMIDLSAIGGSATEVMTAMGDNVYSVETTAVAGTTPGTYNLPVNATDIYGNSNTSVSIPLTVTEPEPTVSIFTDKTIYQRGDTMHVGLNVTNLGDDLPVRFAVWLEKPDGGMYVLTFTSLTLPAGLEYSNPDFAVFTLPRIPSGTYTWNAAIIEPYGPMEFISHDTAEWSFGSSTGTGTEMPTEDISRVLEQAKTTIVIDFGG